MIPLKNSPEPSTKCMGSSPGGRLEPYVRSSKPHLTTKRDFPGNSAGKKKSVCNAEDLGLIPGLGRSPGGGKSHPLHYSCLKSPHGQRSLVGYSLWGCKKSDTTERLSTAQWWKRLLYNVSALLHWKYSRIDSLGFLSGSVVHHLPMHNPLVWEDPTCHGATKPVCHNYWACALEHGSCNFSQQE